MHSVAFVAGGAGGATRICNGGAGFWGTSVAPRGRVGQGAVASFRRSYGCLGPIPRLGVGFPRGRSLAWARVARLCVCFKGAGEIAGLETDWWGEMAQTWGLRGSCVGRAWGKAGIRVARESDGFFGVRSANGSGVGGRGAAGVRGDGTSRTGYGRCAGWWTACWVASVTGEGAAIRMTCESVTPWILEGRSAGGRPHGSSQGGDEASGACPDISRTYQGLRSSRGTPEGPHCSLASGRPGWARRSFSPPVMPALSDGKKGNSWPGWLHCL